MNGLATITSKNQLTIPTELIHYFGLKRGSRVYIRTKNQKMEIEPIKPGFKDLQGALADTSTAKKYTTEQIIKIAGKKEALRIANHG